MTAACIIHCAVSCVEEAELMAQALLEERLAACVQLSPIASRYVWKGQMEASNEVMLTVKTRADLFEQVRQRIRRLHSYDTPEIIATSALAVDADYLAWLEDSTRSA